MAGSVTCPRCGAANNPGTLFCVNCGSSLSAGAGSPTAAPPMYPGAMPGLPSAWEGERQKQIGRTKTGVLLLLIGALIGWLPVVGFVGSLLTLGGVILVILGRKAFGSQHQRNVMISIGLFIVGIIIIVVAFVVLFGALSAGLFGGTPTQAAISSALNNYLIISLVGTIVSGLASIFFTYALQNQMGRILLFAGYGANVAVQIAVIALVSQAIPGILALMFPNGVYDPAAATAAMLDFSGRVQAIALLQGIPALLFAGANYIAWTRISKGEIPASTTPPPMAQAPLPPR